MYGEAVYCRIDLGRGPARRKSTAQTQPPLPVGGIPARGPWPERREGGNTPPKVEDQLREGVELVDQPGSFKTAGDRVVFFLAGGKQQLIGLENLNLERIVRVLADNTNPLEWFVTGTVTEFRGTNYLFVRRAMFKNRGARTGPAPAVAPCAIARSSRPVKIRPGVQATSLSRRESCRRSTNHSAHPS